MLYWLRPDVILGGGKANFRPSSIEGGKRKDGEDYIGKFTGAGYAFAETAAQLAATAGRPETTKLLGLFNDKNIEPAYVNFALDADGKVEKITLKPVSPLADFSYDYQDLLFTPVAEKK